MKGRLEGVLKYAEFEVLLGTLKAILKMVKLFTKDMNIQLLKKCNKTVTLKGIKIIIKEKKGK